IAGKVGPTFPPVPTPAEVPRCTRNAFGPGTSRGFAIWPAPRGREREDGSLGGRGGGRKKPHLCGAEARYHERSSAAGAREWIGGGRLGMVCSEGRRRRLYPGWHRSCS